MIMTYIFIIKVFKYSFSMPIINTCDAFHIYPTIKIVLIYRKFIALTLLNNKIIKLHLYNYTPIVAMNLI